MYCWVQFVNILLRIFMSIFFKDIGFNFLFLVVALSIFGIRVMVASQNALQRVLSFSTFWKSLRRTGISSLCVWVKLTCEAIWSGIFVCRKFTNYKLYFESSDWSALIIYMILLDLIVWAEVSQNLAGFFQVVKFVGI